MNWAVRSTDNIFSFSVNKSNLSQALKEWLYTGDMFDLEQPIEECELCEHPEIRYQFKIINQHNGNEMLVGSECINKFQIIATDTYGNLLNNKESRRKVNRDKRHLVTEARRKRQINTLLELARVEVEERFDINSFIDYVQDRDAFTPNQLTFLFWRLKENKIEYNNADFKLIICRNREKNQLLEMSDWKIRQLWKSMSSNQQSWYIENKGL